MLSPEFWLLPAGLRSMLTISSKSERGILFVSTTQGSKLLLLG